MPRLGPKQCLVLRLELYPLPLKMEFSRLTWSCKLILEYYIHTYNVTHTYSI